MYSARTAAWAITRSLRNPDRAAELQAMYTSQLMSRMELARTLALPQYNLSGPASTGAKQAMRFIDAKGQALAKKASSLTARSQHFRALVDDDRSGTADDPPDRAAGAGAR
jgi:hypothetical protein